MNLRDDLMKMAVHLEAGNVVDRNRVTDLLRRAAGVLPKESTRCCPCCKFNRPDVKQRRLNTAYPVDKDNYLTSCWPCHQDAVERYAEMWDEYRSVSMG